jgi:hypothetical protein
MENESIIVRLSDMREDIIYLMEDEVEIQMGKVEVREMGEGVKSAKGATLFAVYM